MPLNAARGVALQGALPQKIDVPSATDARRIEFTVPAGERLDAARIVTILALSDDRTLVN